MLDIGSLLARRRRIRGAESLKKRRVVVFLFVVGTPSLEKATARALARNQRHRERRQIPSCPRECQEFSYYCATSVGASESSVTQPMMVVGRKPLEIDRWKFATFNTGVGKRIC